MQILYIDADKEAAEHRADWFREDGHEVSVVNDIHNAKPEEYDLLIVNLGKRGSEFDIRVNLSHSQIYRQENTKVLFTDVDGGDKLYSENKDVPYTDLVNLAHSNLRVEIMQKIDEFQKRITDIPYYRQ